MLLKLVAHLLSTLRPGLPLVHITQAQVLRHGRGKSRILLCMVWVCLGLEGFVRETGARGG